MRSAHYNSQLGAFSIRETPVNGKQPQRISLKRQQYTAASGYHRNEKYVANQASNNKEHSEVLGRSRAHSGSNQTDESDSLRYPSGKQASKRYAGLLQKLPAVPDKNQRTREQAKEGPSSQSVRVMTLEVEDKAERTWKTHTHYRDKRGSLGQISPPI